MTEFEKKVLKEVLKIPIGEIRTYSEIAKLAGKPKAYRAAANAVKKNPFPVFIPCHRVIKSNGDTGGYSLGKEMKKKLINLEKKIKDMLK
ncbi:MAG: methylated-DNA--[protein]-cysteine S-methyltransferase [Candidatus Omnitrophica bacterium]|nr:methylated-DNA--[protein]-cysteine S-methyltransferase [Candidatus Omnitrophota bacterium]